MCLIVFAWKSHPSYRLVLAANRDEYHARPAREAGWWPDHQNVLAGRDLQAGGTWLAVSRDGLFATVTNYRELQRSAGRLRSRGEIVSKFVTGRSDPHNFALSLDGEQYAGFSLLAADRDQLVYSSNGGDKTVVLEPGVYGLSNASLDTPWFKLVRSRRALQQLIDTDSVSESSLLRILADRQTAPVDQVDSSILPFALAQTLSAPFIVSPEYGTRCSTTLLWSNTDEVEFCERRFDARGKPAGTARHRFTMHAPHRR